MQCSDGYELVRLANGTYSIRSLGHDETFHPVIGPVAEAEALYVRQLALPQRVERQPGRFIIWDVGLGSAANPLTVIRALSHLRAQLQIVSFDTTLEPLRFALRHAQALGYVAGFEEPLDSLLDRQHTQFAQGPLAVDWQVCVGDFPSLLRTGAAKGFPKPHAILFDAYSPAKNPAMWTEPLFADIFAALDPRRPCAMATYSRSTMLRVSLLLAGFFVGAGQATGEKEETTIAANTLELIREPLDREWLRRARRSTSAEPLREAVYRQAPLAEETWERLKRHPQFQ